MPTAFVIQEHLTPTSALTSLLGEGEEQMNQSHLWMLNVQAWSTKTREKFQSFAQAGHPAGGQKSGFFVSWEQRDGKILTTATPRNAAFLLYHPLSRPFG